MIFQRPCIQGLHENNLSLLYMALYPLMQCFTSYSASKLESLCSWNLLLCSSKLSTGMAAIRSESAAINHGNNHGNLHPKILLPSKPLVLTTQTVLQSTLAGAAAAACSMPGCGGRGGGWVVEANLFCSSIASESAMWCTLYSLRWPFRRGSLF